MDKMKMETPDLTQSNIKRLATLFPACITEVQDEYGGLKKAVNFEMLRQMLSDKIVEGNEVYEFTWVGKKAAIVEANRPIRKTLRPYMEEGVDWNNTENLYIEGDNLEVLKLLQESYLGKIKMIYIDPPYNTGRNLLYRNDFHIDSDEYLESSAQVGEEGKLVTNLRTYGRFHSAWLSMLYQRLLVARNLLTRDGILVCAIDENEQASLEMILREVFCEDSYDHVCVTVVHNPRGVQGKNFSYTHEYAIFVFPKNIKIIADRKIEEEDVDWSPLRNWGSESERTDARNCFYPVIVKEGKVIGFGDVSPDDFHPQQTEKVGNVFYVYPIDRNGIERKWRYARQTVESIKDMLRAKKTEIGYNIELGKTFGLQRTVWVDKRYDANVYGTKMVADLVPNSGFSFPKSLWTVYDAVVAATANDKDSIILDFFSGSATTAHAIMQLNAEDNGHRKFIMVQLPEPCDEKSEAYKAGYKNICEIGKERIRRAAKKIAEDNPGKPFDGGFRVFKIDDSNMTDVYYSAGEYDQAMLSMLESNIKPDRTDLDLLFGCLLEWGLPLSMPYTSEQIDGCTVHTYNDGDLIACFNENISDSVVKEIAKRQPLRAVFRDSSFANSPAKINLGEIFKMLAPDTRVKVL